MSATGTSEDAARFTLGAAPAGGGVPRRLKIAYGLPNLAGAGVYVLILVYLPKFYADVVLLPLGYLAIVMAVARSLDALNDPFIGWLSDRTRTRFGRRRPFIAAGAPLCAAAFFALFSPPATLSTTAAGLWFGITVLACLMLYTSHALPYYALGLELTPSYHERSRLFGVREAFTIIGTLSAAVLPGVLLDGWGLSERQAHAVTGGVFGALLAGLFVLLAVVVRERPGFMGREANPFVPGVRRALRNRPFRILLLT